MLDFFYNNKIKKLINFNKLYFNDKIKIKNNAQILCEFSDNYSNIVAFSYLNYVLKKKYKCKSVGYINVFRDNYLNLLKLRFQKIINYRIFALYKSFLIDDFTFAFQNSNIQKTAENYLKQNFNKIKNNKDILNLKVNNILIGDYIYDSYLKENKLPTIFDINDKKFKNFLEKSLYGFFFWLNYIKKNKIVAVILSHTVYADSMIARIASHRNITCYQCNWHNVQKIKKNRKNAYLEFKTFKKDFANLPIKNKKIAIKKTEIEIKRRLNYGIGFDNINFKRPTFDKNFSNKRIIKKSKRKKILISSHCFLDAPHSYGPKGYLFEDFYIWLKFLYDFSKETTYDWYIKSHPNQLPYSKIIMREFLKNKKNFIYVSPSISNLQLIKEGVDCVLTVYGTVGWEFAYFKIPVINASTSNPHINYNFNLHARNIEEYKNMILNFSKYKLNYDKKKIVEYYFMKNIYTKSDWMFDDYYETMKEINGYNNLRNQVFYEYWIKNFSKEKFLKIMKTLERHILSKDNFLTKSSYLK